MTHISLFKCYTDYINSQFLYNVELEQKGKMLHHSSLMFLFNYFTHSSVTGNIFEKFLIEFDWLSAKTLIQVMFP